MHGPFHVVRTKSFRIEPGEDVDTNPKVYGRALANYIAEQLRIRGEPVERILAEDFGWCVLIRRKPLRVWIGCGNRAGSAEEWTAWVAAEGGLWRRLLGRVNVGAEINRLSETLGEIMRGAPGLTDYSIDAAEPASGPR